VVGIAHQISPTDLWSASRINALLHSNLRI
jgi:hypothetical protein